MQTVADTELPEATLRRHAAELAQVKTLLKKAQSIIDRQAGESEGRPGLLNASSAIDEAIIAAGGVEYRLTNLADGAAGVSR